MILMSGCYFQKGLFIHFRVCGIFFIFCQRQIDMKFRLTPRRGYLTLWCHQPHPGQSLNPQTVVEFGGQKVESGWIFQRVLSLVVKKHSCKLGYQDKFLVLKHSSLIVSCICFSRTFLVLSHRGLLQEKYKKLQEQFLSLGDV